MRAQNRSYSLGCGLGLMALLLPLAGCVSPGGTGAGASVALHAANTPDGAREIRIKTADGWTVVGDLYTPKGVSHGVVVLLHQRGGQASDWTDLCQALQKAGITALAIDQRGAGRSTQGPGPIGEEAPWSTGNDISAAIVSLKGRGAIGLAGASYGANNALIYAAAHPGQIKALALLSPGDNYHGLDALKAARKVRAAVAIYHDRDDSIAGQGPGDIDKLLPGRAHHLTLYPGGEHGTGLLDQGVIREATRFFTRSLK